MKIAIAQLNPTIGNLVGNAQQILDAARQAAAQGARLMLTPELSLCGYPPRDLLLQPAFIAAMSQTLEKLAGDLPRELTVLVGTVEPNRRSSQEGGKPLFNSTALLENGKIQQIFHKRLLPTYDVFDEDRYFEPGQESTSFVLDLHDSADQNGNIPSHSPLPHSLTIGVTICEDVWNDEEFWGQRNYRANPIAELVEQGVDFIVNLSASPYTIGKQKLREAMLHHAANRYRMPMLYANQVGGNDDLLFDGSSVGFDRQGKMVCRGKAFEPDLVIVEFDPTTHDFRLDVAAIAPQPLTPDAEVWSALVLGVQDYIRKCGFSKVVLGLSGGIDSALVAAVAAAAIGAENVLGVLMPSPYSSDHSISDALALAQNLGIQTQLMPIGDLMKTYDQTFAELFAGTEFGIAEENIQSRIRGSLLMAISNKFGHLLLSTGNKSEMAVGYCTLYGDMNGGLAAIADVPKTRVYSICEWLNQSSGKLNGASEVIPANILTKAPSAELKPGQVDQDSLPAYEILDDILAQLIHEHKSPTDLVASGHNPATVDRIVKLVIRAEFKRKQAPPGIKVTDRAFGTGWRMPIAQKWMPTLSATQAAPSAQSLIQGSEVAV
ncbi:MAG: NAD+ synthase [Drouetiella hepatica Uher 2000/2452]|jgi:NAD+ synthetase|uniref:Glutamine-dependent NAD(+) synthetase n=1 Tax=Drouetiella hepatica Uher 2000/2452 TaxID=904376 RepID=A0A951UNE8_9CYAN|nr:NAD+ synthase [Drouetiella hepatica Uher 2000/2452]